MEPIPSLSTFKTNGRPTNDEPDRVNPPSVSAQDQRVSSLGGNILQNSNFRCKKTNVLLRDPVTLTPCGDNLDRTYAQQFFREKSPEESKCPCCGVKVQKMESNTVLRDLVEGLLRTPTPTNALPTNSSFVQPRSMFNFNYQIPTSFAPLMFLPIGPEVDYAEGLEKYQFPSVDSFEALSPTLLNFGEDIESPDSEGDDQGPIEVSEGLKDAILRKRSFEEIADSKEVVYKAEDAAFIEMGHAIDEELFKFQEDIAKVRRKLKDVIQKDNPNN